MAALVAALGSTELRELRLRVPWYGILYNHAVAVLPAIAAALTYGAAVGFGTPPGSTETLGAVLLAGLVYVGLNETLSAAAIALREERSLRAVLTADLRAYGLAFIGLTPVAWLMALALSTIGPVAALLFALPLYTTRASYQSVVEVRKMFTQTVRALASAIDARDPSTKKHSEHVSSIAVEIGVVMRVSEAELEQLEWGGLLHDIGKIGVRDAVLLKPDRLNKEERTLMNKHPETGEEILRGVEKLAPELPLIRHHHEWYNGSGYPDKRIGEDIPFLARILHVADAFEAMTAVRPYRLRPLTSAQALDELRKYAGIQFDPRVVEAFARTRTAQGTDAELVPEAVTTPIPMLGQVASRRAQGNVTTAVPLQPDSH